MIKSQVTTLIVLPPRRLTRHDAPMRDRMQQLLQLYVAPRGASHRRLGRQRHVDLRRGPSVRIPALYRHCTPLRHRPPRKKLQATDPLDLVAVQRASNVPTSSLLTAMFALEKGDCFQGGNQGRFCMVTRFKAAFHLKSVQTARVTRIRPSTRSRPPTPGGHPPP